MLSLTNTLTKVTFKKKETWLFLVFCTVPLLLIVGDLLGSNFLQLNAMGNKISFMDFFNAVLSLQYKITLPIMSLTFLISSSIHDEIKNGVLFLYKDMNRSKILNSKLLTFITVLFNYIVLLFIACLVTYYTDLRTKSYTTGKFWGSVAANQDAIAGIVGLVCLMVIIIFLSTAVSLNLSNGFTLLIGTVFAVLSTTLSQVKNIKYIFPNSYANDFHKYGFNNTLIITLGITLIYLIVIYAYSSYKFKHLEY
ncbi:hypothetical protein DS831_02985 [Bombilactobacillus bombi]|uniref:Amino acid transporter n=1 Tax=Bombilactobacillus bombi TaxID=1303590 RepID=A0A417ZJX1_9LACO|nr:hypothetical protein [Bombilactobacillus bombi]RHW52304.1 hypothetical protein DS831_02985 [Bombilactobacillus bombi]